MKINATLLPDEILYLTINRRTTTMNSLEDVRNHMRVEFADNKAKMTVKIDVDKNGALYVNGGPMGNGAGKWLHAGRYMLQMIEEFEQQYRNHASQQAETAQVVEPNTGTWTIRPL